MLSKRLGEATGIEQSHTHSTVAAVLGMRVWREIWGFDQEEGWRLSEMKIEEARQSTALISFIVQSVHWSLQSVCLLTMAVAK